MYLVHFYNNIKKSLSMTTRRTFFKQTSVLATGLLLSQSCMTPTATAKKVKQIGLQLYTLRDELTKDVKGSIAQLGQIGFNHLETYFDYEGATGKKLFWGLTAKELKTLMTDNKLLTHSGHYQLNDFLTAGNGKDDALKFQLDLAAQLGQTYFVVPVPPAGTWDKLTAENYKFMSVQFNKAGEICQKAGLKFAYHNHYWEFKPLVGTKTGFDIMMAETDPKLVDFELDLFWATKAGVDPVSLFQKYPKRIVMWHVKDMDKSKTEPVYSAATPSPAMGDVFRSIKFAEVGTGAINFKEIFKHKEDLKYYFVEQDQITLPNKFDSVKMSFDYINNTLLNA